MVYRYRFYVNRNNCILKVFLRIRLMTKIMREFRFYDTTFHSKRKKGA